jgi:hypothetical protein
MSDFFGCMTGLPYIGIDILGLINALETPALYSTYKNLYLAVTWEPATVLIDYTTNPNLPFGPTTYTINSVTINNYGGGYGRDGAPTPSVSCSWAPATATIGTDDTVLNPATLSPSRYGNFGRLISINGLGTFPQEVSAVPTLTIGLPPGTGSFSNSVVQGYIDAANIEILAIQTSKQRLSEQMNSNWNETGTQLTIEQRALNTALPVAVPPILTIDDLAQFPTTQYAFTDSVPQYALNTDPHMQAQSIEAIANLCLPGGQSIVGMMREARNQARLTQIGISLDNNISDAITVVENKTLLANGSINNTPPAKLSQVDCTTGNEVAPNPYGSYDPEDNNYYVTNPAYLGPGGISNIGNNGWTGTGQVGGGSTPALPSAVDVGNAVALGSFAGSPYTNIIPANLNVLYTSNNLLPSTYTIPEAIDEVIRCNCDCWDMI